MTKDSNLTAYTAWDVDGRVNHMESEFKELRSMLNDTLTQKRSDDDAYELARARGEWCCANWTARTGLIGFLVQFQSSRTLDKG